MWGSGTYWNYGVLWKIIKYEIRIGAYLFKLEKQQEKHLIIEEVLSLEIARFLSRLSKILIKRVLFELGKKLKTQSRILQSKILLAEQKKSFKPQLINFPSKINWRIIQHVSSLALAGYQIIG